MRLDRIRCAVHFVAYGYIVDFSVLALISAKTTRAGGVHLSRQGGPSRRAEGEASISICSSTRQSAFQQRLATPPASVRSA
jgi:hypothetical protein